jgi:DNA (cytosine-5)-methyltransferase 1
MSNGNKWQHRVADTLEERFGLLDPANGLKYRRTPTFEAPQGDRASRPLKAMGLTCGIGSMLVGAQKLGFEVVGNVEWRDYYRYQPKGMPSTFTHNFKGAFIARGTRDVPADLLPGAIDFAAGHPECGRYSTLSYSVTQGNGAYQEGRGSDVSDIPLFLKLVAMFKPRFFLMDDLPDSFGPLPMSEYIKALPDYDLFPEWISNWGYGNIQKYRNRMFVVGALKKEKFVFVPGEAEHKLVLRDMIHDLQTFGVDVSNHADIDLDYVPGRYVNMRWLGDRPSWRDLQQSNANFQTNIPYVTAEGEEKIRPGTRSPGWEEWCPVLSGGFNPIHPLRRTPLSVRERARIQGFDDDFEFLYDDEGPRRKVWEPYNSDGQRGIKQTGKAMPLQFCTFVADQVKHHIEGKAFPASNHRVIKANDKVSAAKLDFCDLSGYADQDRACRACWLRSSCHIYQANNPGAQEVPQNGKTRA